ncbi:MAG: thioredoxin domain-containing protein [Gemmataceae bacterium]|nr:thioredoxin domain-containing protein [Gemmataceae bacterium]
MTQPQVTNRLIHETSPYLRQHAHNPVDWHAWGEEALRKARELDRPIFLSIGYSACHWCHVMEHESFEDPEVGKILNEHFISIKVDREERPDLDQIYMTAVQILTQRGGWPMSMFLTPDLKPFYGGTYFPPADRHGLPSFQRLLLHLARAWKEQRAVIDEQSGHLTEHLQAALHLEPGQQSLGDHLLKQAGQQLARRFDPTYGGFGQAPKFPHPMEIRLLLRLWQRFGDDNCLDMARKTLDHMARGGMYDQLGGGFHRYSTDDRWLVPHFEKMLYDNALLTSAYVEAFQATREPFYQQVVAETLGYVLREMTSPAGPFYSTQDADSEGVEGKFFVWSPAEVAAILGMDEARLFAAVYDVTEEGNWEEHNILHRRHGDEQDAKLLGMPVDELRRRLQTSKDKLLAARNRRVRPGRDEKILTAWNGLMIGAFAQAGQVFEEPNYIQAAERAADWILKNMRTADGRLLRTAFADSAPKLNGYLEDYTYLMDALVTLYETTFEPRWLTEAVELARVLMDQFWDEAEGGFFYTGKDHEQLIARTKDPHDQATPSGNSMAATALLRLAKLTGRADFFDKAERTLTLFGNLLHTAPMAAGQMLLALDFQLGPVREYAVVGDAVVGNGGNVETRQVLRLIRQRFEPRKVVCGKRGTTLAEDVEALVPLLANRAAQGIVTTYICENQVCLAPVVGARALEQALETR